MEIITFDMIGCFDTRIANETKALIIVSVATSQNSYCNGNTDMGACMHISCVYHNLRHKLVAIVAQNG